MGDNQHRQESEAYEEQIHAGGNIPPAHDHEHYSAPEANSRVDGDLRGNSKIEHEAGHHQEDGLDDGPLNRRASEGAWIERDWLHWGLVAERPELTDRRWSRALAADPASHEPMRSKPKRPVAVRVERFCSAIYSWPCSPALKREAKVADGPVEGGRMGDSGPEIICD